MIHCSVIYTVPGFFTSTIPRASGDLNRRCAGLLSMISSSRQVFKIFFEFGGYITYN